MLYSFPTISFLFFLICTVPLSAQELKVVNQTYEDDKGLAHLIGPSTRSALAQEPYNEWYSKYYDAYEPDQAIIEKVNLDNDEYRILVFMGTWCGDSKRQVPKFYKVMDQLGFPEKNIELVNVYRELDQYKMSPGGEEVGLNIHRVPTFIFYKNDQEVGRIVESPITSMTTDVSQTLLGVPTQPRYIVVSYLESLFSNQQHQLVDDKLEAFGNYTARNTTTSAELNTYGYVLMAQEKYKEAIKVFEINTLAYPHEANTFDSLGEAYLKAGDKEQSKSCYEKALQIDPNLESAKEALKTISG